MVSQICNPSTGRLGQKECSFQASLGYIAKPPSLKRKNESREEMEKGGRDGGKEGGERERTAQALGFSFLSTSGSWGWNSGHHSWQQAPLPAELSYQP